MAEAALKIEVVDPIINPSDNPMRNKWWRLNNLYLMLDEDGKEFRFRCNTIQTILFEEMWNQNNILKSRQHGCTTYIDLYILDEVLFNSNIEAGIVTHREESATKIFQNKIIYPYQHLDPEIKTARPTVKRTEKELAIRHPNDRISSVYVSVTIRSGTVQYLHISELGYICANTPLKSKEVVAGSMQAIHGGNIIWIESTAEGAEGHHYEFCIADMALAKEVKSGQRIMSQMDRKFFFFPWNRDPKNADDTVVPINTRMQNYFKMLKTDHGINLTKQQKYWYVRKEKTLGHLIKAQHPSTPEEAFEGRIEGQVFQQELGEAREEGRICDLPIRKDIPVDTWWDLGLYNRQAIWFSQTVGGWIHLINYYENHNEGIIHYVDILNNFKRDNGIEYKRHYAPHDIAVREWSDAETRWIKAQKKGITFVRKERVKKKQDSLEAARDIFPICKFDRVRCAEGIKHLGNYRYQYDDHLGVYSNEPNQKDACAHGADSYQLLACGHEFHHVITAPAMGREIVPSGYVY